MQLDFNLIIYFRMCATLFNGGTFIVDVLGAPCGLAVFQSNCYKYVLVVVFCAMFNK